MWDQTSARRVDRFIANSETTRRRIQKYYRRDAEIIYPPVNVDRFTPTADNKGYFLLVSRLAPYKRADLVVNTFNKLELPLVVIGTGRDADRLRRAAGRTVTFKGFVSDRELPMWYAGARAVIFPSDDDFGIVPVEAMASGKPVIALRRGGATETIIEGVTGEFFDEPVEAFLAETVRQFLEKEQTYDPLRIRKQAERFSCDVFRTAMTAYVERTWSEWQQGRKIALHA
jgi:glycosyltransferase involved in cell wall biosynthesis